MLNAVFICDKEWFIKEFMTCSQDLPLKRGDNFIEKVEERELLLEDADSCRALILTLRSRSLSFFAKIRIFPEGKLLMLCDCNTREQYAEASNLYEKGVEWAKYNGTIN